MKVKKTKKKIKRVLSRKLLKKRAARRVYQSLIALIFATSAGSIVFAIALSKPPANVAVSTQIRPISVTVPVSSSSEPPADQAGTASWYALGLPHPELHTCASTRFPRGTYLLVKNMRNSKTVVCLVNDYGPAAFTNRVIDLSLGSFVVIESPSAGTTPVQIRVVPPPPAGINLPFPSSFGQLLGYNLCNQEFTVKFCESNRQSPKNLR